MLSKMIKSDLMAINAVRDMRNTYTEELIKKGFSEEEAEKAAIAIINERYHIDVEAIMTGVKTIEDYDTATTEVAAKTESKEIPTPTKQIPVIANTTDLGRYYGLSPQQMNKALIAAGLIYEPNNGSESGHKPTAKGRELGGSGVAFSKGGVEIYQVKWMNSSKVIEYIDKHVRGSQGRAWHG